MNQTSMIYYVFKLMDRGLPEDKINEAMGKMVGPDWKEVKIAAWLQRLKNEGYVSETSSELSVDELEALIMGCLKLSHFREGKF